MFVVAITAADWHARVSLALSDTLILTPSLPHAGDGEHGADCVH